MYQTKTKQAKKEPELTEKPQELTVALFPEDEDKKETTGFLAKRFQKLEEDRPDADWDIRNQQFESVTYFKPDGSANINLPIERATIENKLADEVIRKPQFNFIPVEPDDVDKVSVADALWDFVWTEADTDKELFNHKLCKNTYGTGVWFESIHTEVKTEFLPKVGKDGKVTGEAKITKMSWIKGESVDIRDVYFPVGKDIEDAEDCFYLERNVTKDTLENLRHAPNYDEEQVDIALTHNGGQQNDKRVFINKEEAQQSDDQKDLFTLYHYFNKAKGIYIVAVDNKVVIREGITPYAHGELPFSIEVDHKDLFSMYGTGECELLEPVKYERNVQRNMMIDMSRRSNDVKLMVGQGVSFESADFADDVTQVMSFDGELSQMQHIKPPVQDSSLQNVDKLLQDDGTWITGIDINSLLGAPSKTAFEARLQEQNKLKRVNLSILQSDFFFTRMARQRLSNIQQWMPITTGKKIVGNNPKFRSILIKDKVSEKVTRIGKDSKPEEKGIKLVDKKGSNVFLELKPSQIRSNLDVQVTTPSTTSVLNEINNLELKEVFNDMVEVIQVNPELAQKFDLVELFKKRIEGIGQNAKDFIIKKDESADIKATREEVMGDLPLPPKPQGQPERQQLNPITENPELEQIAPNQ